MLMLGSTCFGHHYAHHMELTTIPLVTHRPSGSRVAAGWKLSALNFQPAAIREPDGLCGNQRYRRELQMMGIMVSETC